MKARTTLLLTCVLATAITSIASAHEPHVFFAQRIFTGNEVIENGVMVVDHDKIVAVGPRNLIEVPDGAVKHDLGSSVIIPGLVIAQTSLGETARDDERTLTPEVKAVDGFDFFTDYSKVIAGGVTTVQVSPGQRRLMPGQGGVVKLAGNGLGERVLSDAESLRVILSSASRSAPRIYEPPTGAVSVDNPLKPTRPQLGGSLASAVAGLRAILRTAQDGPADNAQGAAFDFDALSTALKTGRLRITANTAAEVRAAMKLAEEFKLKLTLVDPTRLDQLVDADKAPEFLNGVILNVGVRPGSILNPAVPSPEAPKRISPWEYAAKLVSKGLGDTIAIRPSSDADLDDMLFLGGLFTRGGTSTKDALSMLTSNPAKLMGVDDRVGSLKKGLDADFVVLSSDPFKAGSTVLATWIGGSSAFDRDTADRMTMVQVGTVYDGNGHMHENATIVVGGNKIRGIGSNVSAPGDAKVKRYPNGVIVPGFIDMSTGLGLGGTVSGASFSTKLGERLTADDDAVKYARQGGVTTAVLTPTGSTVPVLAFKLGETPRVLKDPVGIKFTISSNLTTGIPALKRSLTTAKTYHESFVKYDAAMVEYKAKLKEYEAAKAKYDAAKKAEEAKKAAAAKKAAEEKAKADAAKKTTSSTKKTESSTPEKKDEKPAESREKTAEKSDDKKTDSKTADKKTTEKKADAKSDPNAPKKPTEPKKPRTSTTYEVYRALFTGKMPAFVEADTALKIKAAVKLFREEFKLKTILVGANDLYRLPELLAENDVSVSLGPTLIREIENDTHNLPQILANNQIPFGFQSKATTGVRQLPWAIQYAVHKGLGTADALTALTGNSASMLSLQDHVGSLGVGKDADLVVLSGPPFEISSEVLAVMIDGVWVYEKETE